MAEASDIFGNKISGKIGPVTCYEMWGKTVVRSLPGKRTGKMTQNQLRNQHRFQQIRKFCSLFKAIVVPQIWNPLATTSSGYHLFMKTNSSVFDKDGILADPMRIRLSMGKLALPEGIQAQRTAAGNNSIEVHWEKDGHIGGLSLRDQLMVISAGEGKYSEMKATGLSRGNPGGIFELPELDSATTHIYLFFESLDHRNYSESICFEI